MREAGDGSRQTGPRLHCGLPGQAPYCVVGIPVLRSINPVLVSYPCVKISCSSHIVKCHVFLFECATHRLKFGLTGIERSKATPGARYQYSLTRYLVLYVTLRVLINYKQASSVLAIGRTGIQLSTLPVHGRLLCH